MIRICNVFIIFNQKLLLKSLTARLMTALICPPKSHILTPRNVTRLKAIKDIYSRRILAAEFSTELIWRHAAFTFKFQRHILNGTKTGHGEYSL